MSEVLLIENVGAVRVLTMNRPDKLNALNNALTEALLHALLEADRDGDVGAVVLTGAGRGFCAGADVTEFRTTNSDPTASAARGALTMRLHAAFAEVDVPIVCAINGVARGGGCGLAIAGDMAIAAESATLGYPEVTRGAVAAVVMANLVRQVGRKAAYELVALGQPITAARALQLGMINRVVADADLRRAAIEIATQLAAHPRHAQRATKRLFHRVADIPLPQALEIGRDANMIMRSHTINDDVKAAGSR